MIRFHLAVFCLLGFVQYTLAIAWSSPHHYPGKPDSPYSEEWQDYFEVTDPLPNISFSLGRSWAGTVSVKDEDNKNNSLFFWGFEKSNGSMTKEDSEEPWGIWLSGGPGYASIMSMMLGTGPFNSLGDSQFAENPHSWHNIADFFWIDNPVGVGFSTVGKGGYPSDEVQVAIDFWNFIENLVKVFPTLKKRPLSLTGESYAGRFITYILKQYFDDNYDPPVEVKKIMIGSPSINNPGAFENVPISRVIETWPQLVDYDSDVLEYFYKQTELCGMDVEISYPQKEKIPFIKMTEGGLGDAGPLSEVGADSGDINNRRRRASDEAPNILEDIVTGYESLSSLDRDASIRAARKAHWKREHLEDPSARHWAVRDYLDEVDKDKIDEWYGCDLYHHLMHYAINYTFPWNETKSVNFLDIPLGFDLIKSIVSPAIWMNTQETINAIHAPWNVNWTVIRDYPWDNDPEGTDGSRQPMYFMDDLAANMSDAGMGMIWYSGNNDMLSGHFGLELVIQNTSLGYKDTYGFRKRPETPWYDDQGTFAGLVHQERNWTYLLVLEGGHQLYVSSPDRTHTIVRDFLFGNKDTGLYVAGEDWDPDVPEVLDADGVILATQGIAYTGTYTTTLFAPEATVASWKSAVAALTAESSSKDDRATSSSVGVSASITGTPTASSATLPSSSG